MARYTGPACRLCRREGQKLFLKGRRCLTAKCAFEKRSYPPGEHGRAPQKPTNYSIQLREKQKLKRIYGILERQFRRYFQMAERQQGMTGENLLKILERRLDNVVYRMGFAASRRQARQLVRHGHILVNGKKTDIPSYLLSPGDVVEVKESSRELEVIKEAIQLAQDRGIPAWLEVDTEKLRGKFARVPEREEIAIPIQEHLVVELCSR